MQHLIDKSEVENIEDEVVLVDEQDHEIGFMPKMEAHQKGVLHRAFSVFVFNNKGELLIQQRALTKYHSAGLWSNTCCSHPLPNEATDHAATRRLQEEMGLQIPLKPIFSFIYRAPLENGLTEYEFDHVYLGKSDHEPIINTHEVENFRYIKPKDLLKEIDKNPNNYTEWLKICLSNVLEKLEA